MIVFIQFNRYTPENYPHIGSVEILTEEGNKIFDSDSVATVLGSGFKFVEGPVCQALSRSLTNDPFCRSGITTPHRIPLCFSLIFMIIASTSGMREMDSWSINMRVVRADSTPTLARSPAVMD